MAQSDKEPNNLGNEETSSDDDLLNSLSDLNTPEENENTMQRLEHLSGFESTDADESTQQRLEGLVSDSEGDFDTAFVQDIDIPASGEDTVARLSRFEEEQGSVSSDEDTVGEDDLLNEDSTFKINDTDIVGNAFEDTNTGEDSNFYTAEEEAEPVMPVAPFSEEEPSSSFSNQETFGGDAFGNDFSDGAFQNEFPSEFDSSAQSPFPPEEESSLDASENEEEEVAPAKSRKPKKAKKQKSVSKKKDSDIDIDKSGNWLLWTLFFGCIGIWVGGNIWGFVTAEEIGKGTQLPFFLAAFNSFGAVLMMTPFLLFALRRRMGKITFFDSALALAYILIVIACMILVVVQARYGVKVTPPVM